MNIQHALYLCIFTISILCGTNKERFSLIMVMKEKRKQTFAFICHILVKNLKKYAYGLK